jgi:DNA-binding IclR family transcriptional regulator
VETHADASWLRLTARVRGEYLEMPGLELTAAQAIRLLGLEPPICNRLLSDLVASGFLRQRSDGRYVRGDAL